MWGGGRREKIMCETHTPGHGSWNQSCYLHHKEPVLEEVFPQDKWDHWRKEKLGPLGGEYGGGGDDAENGGHVAENNLREDVLMCGDSVKSLRMGSAGDSRKGALALQEGPFPEQHWM